MSEKNLLAEEWYKVARMLRKKGTKTAQNENSKVCVV